MVRDIQKVSPQHKYNIGHVLSESPLKIHWWKVCFCFYVTSGLQSNPITCKTDCNQRIDVIPRCVEISRWTAPDLFAQSSDCGMYSLVIFMILCYK